MVQCCFCAENTEFWGPYMHCGPEPAIRYKYIKRLDSRLGLQPNKTYEVRQL